MNNFGKLERVIESQQPKYLRDSLIYLAIALFFFRCSIYYKYQNVSFIIGLAIFVSALQGIYLLYKFITYKSNFKCIKLYTHGLMIDDYCFEYKNVILQLKEHPRSMTIVFKNDSYSKKIDICTKRNSVYTIINKIKNYTF